MQLEAEEVILKGCPICRGIAIGKPFFLNCVEYKILELQIPVSNASGEIERYRSALSRSRQDIKRLQKQLEAESVEEGVGILEAQLEMLQDPLMTHDIEKEIRKTRKNAEFVFQQALQKIQARFVALGDAFFLERYKDLQDISRRIYSYLYESGNLNLKDVPPNSIVCAQELTASDAAEAESYFVSAFLTESGGTTSHAAIVAKAKGIPFITNVNLAYIKENANQTIIVDGRTGTIILNPSEGTLKEYEQLKSAMSFQKKDFEKLILWPAQTFDGFTVRLHANIEMPQEIDLIHELGGKGIGLFRSEYIFLPKDKAPSEDEQYEIYLTIIKKMKGMPVVIRTFDLGGDKSTFYHVSNSERNPFLGCRATRFLLKERGLFKSQLKAILRASLEGPASILFPMITTLSELRAAKKILEEVREEMQLFHPIPMGCMIEVPSAALIVDHFVQECDFLSIGTNDLVQYTLAVDRGDQMLSEFYEPTDPSVMRLIKLITTEANRGKVPVSVCGEIASDPRFTPLLLGLGIQELSVAPRYLPVIKNAIRRTSIIDAVQLADRVLNMQTAQEVLDLLIHEYRKNVPHDLCYNVMD
jgi:phosphotransferase system enzyme I (PtsI)